MINVSTYQPVNGKEKASSFVEVSEVPSVHINHQQNLDSIKLLIENRAIPETENARWDMVFLMGSMTKWRGIVAPRLAEAGITSFNPESQNYNYAVDGKLEADAAFNSSTLYFRIESKEGTKNTSLASLAEIRYALLMRKMGKKVIISIEKNFKDSLEGANVIAEYVGLERELLSFKADNVTILFEDGYEQSIEAIISAVTDQRKKETSAKSIFEDKEWLLKYAQKRNQRVLDENAEITFGGSSGSFDKNGKVHLKYLYDRNRIEMAWEKLKNRKVYLYKGFHKFIWDKAYETADSKDQFEAMATAYEAEIGAKNKAVINWSILEGAVSLSAGEIFGIIDKATDIDNPQLVFALHEMFDVKGYLRHLLKKNKAKYLEELGEVELDPQDKAREILERLGKRKGTVTFEEVKSSKFLSSQPEFFKVDAVRRVRGLIAEHFKKLLEFVKSTYQESQVVLFAGDTNIEGYINSIESFVESVNAERADAVNAAKSLTTLRAVT